MTNQGLPEELSTFDEIPLGNKTARRAALQPLYDFYERILEEVGMDLLGLDSSRIEDYPVQDQWRIVSDHLDLVVDDADQWDHLLHRLGQARKDVQHQKEGVAKATLEEFRQNAEDFHDWVYEAGGEYYKQSKHFGLREAFYGKGKQVLRDFEMEENYDSGIPHTDTLGEREGILEKSKSDRDQLERRLDQIFESEEPTQDDLMLLLDLQDQISTLKGRKQALLFEDICPVCGGPIGESQEAVSRRREGGTVRYSIGCQDCEFHLHSETVSV